MTYDGLAHQTLLAYPEIARPADHAGRLVEDLRHDRLAAWVLGLAGDALSTNARKLAVNSYSCVNARYAICGNRRPDRPAGRGSREMVAEFDARRSVVVEGLNDLPGVRAARPRAPLRLPQHRRHRLEGQGARCRPARRSRRRHDRRAAISASFGKGYIRFSYANSPRIFGALWSASATSCVSHAGGVTAAFFLIPVP